MCAKHEGMVSEHSNLIEFVNCICLLILIEDTEKDAIDPSGDLSEGEPTDTGWKATN